MHIDVEAMRLHALRLLSNAIHKRPGGVENLVAKLIGTELNHRMAIAAMDMLGDYATLGRGEQRAFDRGVWSATGSARSRGCLAAARRRSKRTSSPSAASGCQRGRA